MVDRAQNDAHRTARRIKQFLRPDGRKIHIAASPEDAEKLRSQWAHEKPQEEFDLFIHGSPEHVNAIREIHTHHEERRNHLRSEHSTVYEEFEHVHAELDTLSAELRALTEHGVSLDANFSRYGYDARLRTREPESSATSVSSETRDWDAERRRGFAMHFYKKPVVRQYYHKGLLWRSSEKEEVASFEIFLDLLYVGIIAIVGDRAAADPNGASLLYFCITFILSWKLWGDITLIVSWFETDDIVQRICILFVMVCLVGYSTNITNAFDDVSDTYTQLIAFYLAQRMFNAIYFLVLAYVIPMMRGTLLAFIIAIIVPSALWIASIHVSEPLCQIIIWIAIVLDMFASGTIIWLVYSSESRGDNILGRLGRTLEFYPAVNIEHKTERTNAFVTLVLGYSVVALLYQNQASVGINAFFGKAALGLVQAFSFNWIYFEIDSTFNLHTHAIRRSPIAYFTWLTMHLPFIMSFILAAASLSKIVIAHDCPAADPGTLAEISRQYSEAEISDGLRWFYCAGLGIALASMGVISISHEHKITEGQRIRKSQRMAVRFAVAIAIVCLSLARGLNSLQLVGTTTGLVLFVLMVDLYGSTCMGDSFWHGRQNCKYLTECRLRRKDIEAAAKAGKTLNMKDVAGQQLGSKGVIALP